MHEESHVKHLPAKNIIPVGQVRQSNDVLPLQLAQLESQLLQVLPERYLFEAQDKQLKLPAPEQVKQIGSQTKHDPAFK